MNEPENDSVPGCSPGYERGLCDTPHNGRPAHSSLNQTSLRRRNHGVHGALQRAYSGSPAQFIMAAQGGRCSKATDWQPHVVADRELITGRNPASSVPAALALRERLRERAT